MRTHRTAIVVMFACIKPSSTRNTSRSGQSHVTAITKRSTKQSVVFNEINGFLFHRNVRERTINKNKR